MQAAPAGEELRGRGRGSKRSAGAGQLEPVREGGLTSVLSSPQAEDGRRRMGGR